MRFIERPKNIEGKLMNLITLIYVFFATVGVYIHSNI